MVERDSAIVLSRMSHGWRGLWRYSYEMKRIADFARVFSCSFSWKPRLAHKPKGWLKEEPFSLLILLGNPCPVEFSGEFCSFSNSLGPLHSFFSKRPHVLHCLSVLLNTVRSIFSD